MADKAISELVAAEQITATDMFVLEQNGTAKKLTGQILLNWLTKAADGHGGIASIAKVSTSGLADTYRITLADTTTFDFVVTNGKGISKIAKTATNGLVDTYTITFNDGTSSTFTVTNGEKGDKGDNTYTWIKYASQMPTTESHSFGDIADNWMGIYFGASDTAPTDWTEYTWFQIKGEQGEPGIAATLTSSAVEYQVSDSGVIVPSGAWLTSVPAVAQGRYLWTRTTNTFNTGTPVTSYSVARMGMDGSGAVSSVAGVFPGADGNVPLTASDVGALATAGGDMTGSINMNGNPLTGISQPTDDSDAASKGYVDGAVLLAYPVGSIYLSVNATSPASLFGGTWTQLEDRFLLGAGSIYAVGATGGEATHALTTAEMPSHNHGLHSRAVYSGGGSYIAHCNKNSAEDYDFVTESRGGGEAHNNMPPYLVVYMWKRIA